MERETEPEPTNVITLLRGAHWEIKSLLREMDDILDLPAALFELYPRIRIALEAHEAGEKFALYGPMREMPDLLIAMSRGEAAHQEIDRTLRALDRVPFRNQQMESPAWKETFRGLHRAVLEHLAEEEESVFPRLENLVVETRLDALGERYKRGLRGELGNVFTP